MCLVDSQAFTWYVQCSLLCLGHQAECEEGEWPFCPLLSSEEKLYQQVRGRKVMVSPVSGAPRAQMSTQ